VLLGLAVASASGQPATPAPESAGNITLHASEPPAEVATV